MIGKRYSLNDRFSSVQHMSLLILEANDHPGGPLTIDSGS
jgi:hypothetical protein